MFGTCGRALVSKVLWEGDREKANKNFSMLTYILIFVESIFSLLGTVFMKPLASLLGPKGNVLDDATLYGIVITITIVPYLLQKCFQSFLIVTEKLTFIFYKKIRKNINILKKKRRNNGNNKQSK